MTSAIRPSRILARLLRPYFRLTRGLTLGAQGIVMDEEQRVLLVRHGYRAGWFFPGGGVERLETVEAALERELMEEAGVEMTAPPELHGLFANYERFPGDQIAVFRVMEWRRAHVPGPSMEIREHGFFARDRLPEGTDAGTRRRLTEIFDSVPRARKW